jgi:hypothetical protein
MAIMFLEITGFHILLMFLHYLTPQEITIIT